MKIGEVFRYKRPYSSDVEELDGLPNYFYVAHTPGLALPLLDRGISPIGQVVAPEGPRTPAILISSSPHKIGTHETPWQDFFDPDNGRILYYGDNKNPDRAAEDAPGNKLLITALKEHNAPDIEVRKRSVPLVYFRRIAHDGRIKGNVQFQGFGVVSGARLITQYDRSKDRSFSNYAFDFTVFNLAQEHEVFDWKWISDRRDSTKDLSETLSSAPRAWRDWIENGPQAIDRCRRRVAKLLTRTRAEQIPAEGSREAKALQDIYGFYTLRNKYFESLAAEVAESILSSDGGTYTDGWITPASADGGADFIGRLDLGTDFSKIKLVVYGQAKCEKPSTPTGGQHIARTVARLKRGWIGVYVTTSYFSEPVQREIIEDEYPILLVHGKRLAEEVLKLADKGGFKSIRDFLQFVDSKYMQRIQHRRPEEILLW